MNTSDDTKSLLNNCIRETSPPDRQAWYRGKVRDIYILSGNRIAIVATDRISAFDHVFNEAIPFKGQLLNQLAWHAFQNVASLCNHHVIEVPHPNVTIARKCDPLPIEVVVRGYLTGHAWRTYSEGKRQLCGVEMPDGMVQHQQFPKPIITPSTKAHEGHDEDISETEIIKRRLVSPDRWEMIKKTAIRLYEQGAKIALSKGLLLVDTKYEFGLFENQLVLIDEVHTTDSSRYFYADGYEDRLKRGAPQKQLSKEFLREWLIENGFQGKAGQQLPVLSDVIRISIYERYRELYEKLTGEVFKPVSTENFDRDLAELLNRYDS